MSPVKRFGVTDYDSVVKSGFLARKEGVGSHEVLSWLKNRSGPQPVPYSAE